MRCSSRDCSGFQRGTGRLRGTERHAYPEEERMERMSAPERGGGFFGISLGGIIVIVGIVLMFVWSFWGGLIVTLIGLIAFGGFARGRWY
jgi:hypothetical protein